MVRPAAGPRFGPGSGHPAFDAPLAEMDHMMVMRAQQGAVGYRGRPAVLPRFEVMGFAPTRRNGAAWECATLVPGDQRRSLRGGEEPSFPPEVEHFAITGQDSRDKAGIAGQPSDQAGRHRAGELQAGFALDTRRLGCRLVVFRLCDRGLCDW